VATLAALRRKGSSGYDSDEIDSAGSGDEFGDRSASAPEQQWAPAETRTDITAEQLSNASRVETALEEIRTVWPVVSAEEIRGADGDLDRLAQRIARKVEQPREQVRTRLDEILVQATGTDSYPAH
jgi:hypothetical protein